MPETPDANRGTTSLSVGHANSHEVRAEAQRLARAAQAGWTAGRRPWLGVALASGAVVVTLLLHAHLVRHALWHAGAVYASLPLPTELARLPLSLFMPTAYLPLWGAVAQLLVVIGLSEIVLGRSVTVLVALAGHAGSTLIARALLGSSSAHFFGLAPALAHALDTGPSGATTAVGACLLLSLRLDVGAALLSASLVIAALVAPGLDGVEHTAALLLGLGAGVALGQFYRRASARATRPPRARLVRWWRRRQPGIVAVSGRSLSPR